jgi:hypothetical protein
VTGVQTCALPISALFRSFSFWRTASQEKQKTLLFVLFSSFFSLSQTGKKVPPSSRLTPVCCPSLKIKRNPSSVLSVRIQLYETVCKLSHRVVCENVIFVLGCFFTHLCDVTDDMQSFRYNNILFFLFLLSQHCLIDRLESCVVYFTGIRFERITRCAPHEAAGQHAISSDCNLEPTKKRRKEVH